MKSAQVAMTIMTNRGLNSILKERVKLGVDVDTALINSGVGYSAESTLRLADIYSFSDNSGMKYKKYNLEFFGLCRDCKLKQ